MPDGPAIKWSFKARVDLLTIDGAGGGTQHVTQSITTVNKYAPPGKTVKGSVGATHDNIEGVYITVASKKGWEYMWVRYADAEDAAAKAIVKKPLAVYVEKVYEEGDFSKLKI